MAEEQKPPTQPEPSHTTGTGKGEEKKHKDGTEAGRQDTGTTGKAQRPAGKSTADESTGVDPKGPVDPESPHLPTP
jgi:hypothetical protein